MAFVMRLMYLAMNFVSFSIPGMMSENRCCSGSMSFFVDIYLIIYIYIYLFFVNIYVDIYIYIYLVQVFHYIVTCIYVHIYICCLICNYDWIVLACIHLIYINARFSAQFFNAVVDVVFFFVLRFKDIVLVETCSNVDLHACVVHENTEKTPAV